MTKTLPVFLLLLLVLTQSFAQESPFTKYIPEPILETIGTHQSVKPDFKPAIKPSVDPGNRVNEEDPTTLTIAGKKYAFMERRHSHNGEVTPFEEYMESSSYRRGLTARIYDWEIIRTRKDSILFNVKIQVYKTQTRIDSIFDESLHKVIGYYKKLDVIHFLREVEHRNVAIWVKRKTLDGVLIQPDEVPSPLSSYPNTEFVFTPEQQFSATRNAAYCASLLFAWDKFRTTIKDPIVIKPSDLELSAFNASTSFLHSLTDQEITSSADTIGDHILLNSWINLLLPFTAVLTKGQDPLNFGGVPVHSFGTYGEPHESVSIVYYKDDNNFVLKLSSIIPEHEVILSMSDHTFNSFNAVVSDIEKKTTLGKTEQAEESNKMKYQITTSDIVDIPMIRFNIVTNHHAIEGHCFTAGQLPWKIETASQRIAFRLDETGVELKSEGEFDVYFSAPYISDMFPPKRMIFNRPFFIMLKRVDSPNPYFGLWVANDELMTK